MNIVPIDNWLVIRPRPQQDKIGSIAIPDREMADKAFFPILGDVLAAGPGMRTADGTVLPMRVKKGDVILLNNLTARRLTITLGNDVNMLREHEVAAIIVEDPADVLPFPTPVKES